VVPARAALTCRGPAFGFTGALTLTGPRTTGPLTLETSTVAARIWVWVFTAETRSTTAVLRWTWVGAWTALTESICRAWACTAAAARATTRGVTIRGWMAWTAGLKFVERRSARALGAGADSGGVSSRIS
jgi:hypothetical protein